MGKNGMTCRGLEKGKKEMNYMERTGEKAKKGMTWRGQEKGKKGMKRTG